jgi:hypothetical protein
MPKLLVLFALAFSVALAADPPKPIPVAEQEAISRKMISAQSDYLAIQQLQIQLLGAQRKAEKSAAEYESALVEAQKKFNAAGCTLAIDKTWNCPAPPNAAPPGGIASPASK